MTRYKESFTGSDSASLAAADVDLSWSDVVPGWSVTSGQAAIASADAVTYARAEADVGGSDMFAEVTLVARAEGSDTAQAAVLARYSSTENTCYMLCRGLDTPNDIAVRRTVGGGRATLVVATVTLELPEVLRLEVEGTALRGYINGTLVVSTTDSAITSGQRAGIYGYRPSGGTIEIDDFVTGLLADPAGEVVELSGVATAASAAPGALGRVRSLAGASSASAGATGSLSRGRPFAGAAASASTAQGSLARTTNTSGVAAAAAAATGSITRVSGLAGVAAAAAAASGDMARARGMIGAAAAAAAAAGVLTRVRSMLGTARAAAAALGPAGAAEPGDIRPIERPGPQMRPALRTGPMMSGGR